jgi:acetyl esterase/lipase
MLAMALAAALAAGGEKPKPPEQPTSGYGGSKYTHAKVLCNSYREGHEQFWILEPAEPTPKSAPVVVFNHGWMGIKPAAYEGWVNHLVRRGHIVIYPRYQRGAATLPLTFTRNAIDAVKRALVELKKEEHVRPDLERFAIVGHSAGGAISADMAALASKEGLPAPKALMITTPGRGMVNARSRFFPPADYRYIPRDIYALVMVAEHDLVVGDGSAKDIYRGLSHVDPERRDYITVLTDRHGSPPLPADHPSPCSPLRPHLIITGRRINAIDYYAYWRLCDALLDVAFHGADPKHCLGNTPEQRFMGRWSDGTPVKELVVTDKP